MFHSMHYHESSILTGCRLFLYNETAYVPGESADARCLTHVSAGIGVSDVPDNEFGPVTDDLVLVLLVEGLVVLEPLDPRQRLADDVAGHRGFLARALRLQPRSNSDLRYRWYVKHTPLNRKVRSLMETRAERSR